MKYHVIVIVNGQVVIDDPNARLEDEEDGEVELMCDQNGWDHIVQFCLPEGMEIEDNEDEDD